MFDKEKTKEILHDWFVVQGKPGMITQLSDITEAEYNELAEWMETEGYSSTITDSGHYKRYGYTIIQIKKL